MKTNIKRVAGLTTAALLSLALVLPASTQMTGDAPLSAKEKADQKVVTDFWREVIQAHNPAAAAKYYAPDMIQHNPNVRGGLQGFQDFFGGLWKNPKPVQPEITPTPVVLMTKGDLVLMVRKLSKPDPTDATKSYDSYWFDLYRVKGGLIVEHWDNATRDAAMKTSQRPAQ